MTCPVTTRILASFQFNERAKRLVDPVKLDQLLRISSGLFHEIYNPQNKRLGIRFLEKEPVSSTNLSVWPLTLREVVQSRETDFPIKLDTKASDQLAAANQDLYEHLPIPTRNVYQSFMRMNDVRRKKKMRSIRAIQGKK